METLVPSKNKTAVGRHRFRVLSAAKESAAQPECMPTLPQPGNVGCEGVQRQSPGAVNELIGSSGSAARCGILLRSWGRFLDMELRRPF